MKRLLSVLFVLVVLTTITPLIAQEATPDDRIDGYAELVPLIPADYNEIPPNLSVSGTYFETGGLITNYGIGFDGADVSRVQDNDYAVSQLIGVGTSGDNRVSDDFTVTDPNGWYIEEFVIPVYQKDSGGIPNFDFGGTSLAIFNGPPGSGGTLVTFAGVDGASWGSLYRDCEELLLDCDQGYNNRPIARIRFSLDQNLPAGTYWWMLYVDIVSGFPAFVPPLSQDNALVRGNGRQTVDGGNTWNAVIDNGVPVGFPFEIYYSVNEIGIDIWKPVGIETSRLSKLTWFESDIYSWYYNRVVRIYPTSNLERVVYEGWTSGADGCDEEGDCDAPIDLSNGSYRWERSAWRFATGLTGTEYSYFTLQTPAPIHQITPIFPGPLNQAIPYIAWNPIDDALWYHVYIRNDDGVIMNEWFRFSDICGSAAWTACAAPVPTIDSGTYEYWLGSWGSGGYGPYNLQPHTFVSFSIQPEQVNLISPVSETLDPGQVRLEWEPEANTTWFLVEVVINSVVSVLNQWIPVNEVCSQVLCEYTFDDLPAASYEWSVLPYGPQGFGLISEATFTLR